MFVNGLHCELNKNYYAGMEEHQITKEQSEIIKDLKFKTYLNMTQLDLNNKNYKRAIFRANKTLEFGNHIKAYFRRGLA